MKTPMWLRPKTTKVYLHRPLSERIGALFPDFKLLTLSLLDNGVHVGQPGVGLLFLQGEENNEKPYTEMCGFDIDKTTFRPVEGGLPIYEINNYGGRAEDNAEKTVNEKILTKVESFAGGERNPTLYFKVTVKNESEETLSGAFGMMPRSGKEKYMVNQHQEGYSPYRPNEKNWYMLKRTWKRETEDFGKGGIYQAKSNMGYLKVKIPFENNEKHSLSFIGDSVSGHSFAPADYFKVSYTLSAGETLTFFGALRAGEPIENFDYAEKRAEAVSFWEGELGKVKRYPKTDDKKIIDIFKHMAAQCLQMLARYEGTDSLSVRQGDITRFVWPYEGSQVLLNLDRIGLSEHTGAAYRGYIERWLIKEGSGKGSINSTAGWENATGSVLFGISEHLKTTKNREELDYFLPYLVMMRDYIETKRHSPRENGYEGIFPSGKGSDWAEIGQFWTFTDSHNCMALRSMYEALKIFDSPECDKTKSIYDDYAEIICKIRDEIYSGHENDKSFILPHMLGIPFEESENYSYYTDGAPYLLYTEFIEPKSRLREQMEEFFRSRGQFENGLTGRMTSCASICDEAYFGGYGDVWYTMQSETYWIKAWLAAGEREKAAETLNACLTYGMTEEYIVSERYCSINPWYSPWQPNGSGSSRMIEILISFYS